MEQSNSKYTSDKTVLRTAYTKTDWRLWFLSPNIYRLSTTDSALRRSYAQSHLWARNIKKARRAAGLDYVGQNGRSMAGRRVKESCPSGCLIECPLNFNANDRQDIHDRYWSLSMADKKRFLLDHVVRMYPQRRRAEPPPAGTSRLAGKQHKMKKYSYKYHFELNGGQGKRLQVCRKFFSSTLDLNRNQLYRLFDEQHVEPSGRPESGKRPNRKC